jgi:hypothetical protein
MFGNVDLLGKHQEMELSKAMWVRFPSPAPISDFLNKIGVFGAFPLLKKTACITTLHNRNADICRCSGMFGRVLFGAALTRIQSMPKKKTASNGNASRPAVAQPETPLTIRQEPGEFSDPDSLIRPFAPALEAMRHSFQRMTVELNLPAYLWIMLKEIAEQKSEHYKDMGALVSELVYVSPKLRAMWFETMGWEEELLPEVLADLLRSNKKLREETLNGLAKASAQSK